jgi:hypothetical protein
LQKLYFKSLISIGIAVFFLMSTLISVSAASKTVTKEYTGYLMDAYCAKKGTDKETGKINVNKNPEKHTTSCLKMDVCMKDVLGISIKQSNGIYRFYKFDKAGSKKAKDQIILKSKRKLDNTIVVKGIISGNAITISNIRVAVSNNTTDKSKEQPKAESTPKPDNAAIKIIKSEITSTAKFYPYSIDGVEMEVIAVKATDGSIRTALNTCQVCYDSGRGYYVQKSDYFVCQNCGSRFQIDKVEIVKGGCNPVPILKENKQDDGKFITISKDFMASQKHYFSYWKK